jgi:AcrR family transcriptional regulator
VPESSRIAEPQAGATADPQAGVAAERLPGVAAEAGPGVAAERLPGVAAEARLGAAARWSPARKRRRNPRGQGARLTGDIVAGAIALIDRTGSGESVTLRAVAREVGIAAPSIYAHFADRDAILMAVVARIFDELTEAIGQGPGPDMTDPVGRLVAGCVAYVAFGLDHPARYAVLFSEPWPEAPEYCKPVALGPDGRPVLDFGAESFALLVEAIDACVKAGASASTDVVADTTAVWVALHGTVSLRIALPRFPWPDPDAFVRGFVLSLAKVRT